MSDVRRVGYMVQLGREMYYLSDLSFESVKDYPLFKLTLLSDADININYSKKYLSDFYAKKLSDNIHTRTMSTLHSDFAKVFSLNSDNSITEI